jgi:NADH:ubiquinone oxidoreductase subunit 5 (subunit L)/multisubunit Na+/H+ antiporter MnhA subunit
MPVTALAFGLGAAAISGLPPLNGFASEWLTFQGLIGAGGSVAISPLGRAAVLVAVGGLGLTVALSLAAFVKATGMGLLALPRSEGAAAAREVGASMRIAMTGLVLACVAAGVAAGPLAGGIARIAAPAVGQDPAAATMGGAVSLPGVDAAYAAAPLAGLLATLLVAAWLVTGRSRRTRRAATWTTGIAPEAKFEYTATSYAKLVRLYFGPVLRPERDVTVELHPGTPFARSVHYRGRVKHVLDERLYRPLHGVAVAAAVLIRRLQSGSLQLYLAYSVTALVLLLLVARA